MIKGSNLGLKDKNEPIIDFFSRDYAHKTQETLFNDGVQAHKQSTKV